MAFQVKNTLQENLRLCSVDTSGNLVNTKVIILKRLSKNEVCEHLGYFHNLSRDLKLPYAKVLEAFKQYHLKLVA